MDGPAAAWTGVDGGGEVLPGARDGELAPVRGSTCSAGGATGASVITEDTVGLEATDSRVTSDGVAPATGDVAVSGAGRGGSTASG